MLDTIQGAKQRAQGGAGVPGPQGNVQANNPQQGGTCTFFYQLEENG